MTDENATPEQDPHGPTKKVVALDASNLRAMAHPVRMELIGTLRKHGTCTVTRLASLLGVSSGTASYHLRQLAANGFVAEDSERGNARERWWYAVHHTTSLRASQLFDQDPDAVLALLQSIAASYIQRLQRGIADYHTLPQPWRQRTDFSDYTFRLTPEEANSLQADLHEVLSRYRQERPDATEAPPAGAERVTATMLLLPEPAEAAEPADTERVAEAGSNREPDGRDGGGTDGTDGNAR